MSDKIYKKFSNNKSKKKKAGKSFFISLAICLVAIGAASWSTFESLKNYIDPAVIESEPQDNTSSIIDKNANKNVSGFFDNQEIKVPSTPEGSLSSITDDTDTDTLTDTESSDSEIISDKYLYPAGQKIGKKFSKNNLIYSETMGDWRVHLGTDFYADKGTKVKPMTTGKVTDVYTDGLLGVTVVIDHGNGVLAYYSGLGSTTLVETGDTVGVGDYIGSLNTVPCESLDEPHLHLGVKVSGEWVDPMSLLEAN